MGFRIAIDTGGTFTDAISVDERGNLATGKAPTTPEDLTVGVRNAVEVLARLINLDLRKFLGQVTTIVHGTTQSTNIIITRTGPKLGMICTEGHRDVIQLRRVPKEDMWNWRMPFPEPLVPRYLRAEIKERVDARGNIAIPLDEASVHKAVSYLKKMKVESIVVALLFSFLRPDHERRVDEIIGEDYPEAHVTLSSSILPIMGEYERTSTATISAYVAPAIVTYTQKLVASLRADGFKGQFLYIQNNGGVETAEVAMENPATVAISGPAAGPSAAILVGKLHGQENLLSIDMGGTSFDIATIVRGTFLTKTESLIDQHRFSLPVIDVSSISAGGGSIAWLDVTNTIRIGPKSAGADPGPACYARGGTEPTVTDANVVLGYISPDYFLGGEMRLRKDLAEKAIR
jgi:N-methylhydantoinase A